MSQKGFTPIVLLVGAIIILGIIYIAYLSFGKFNQYSTLQKNVATTQNTTTSSETTDNWKTYRNNFDGYLINYPSNWTIVDKSQEYDPTGENYSDVQLFNDSGPDCFLDKCVELLLYNDLDISRAKRPTGDAGMSSVILSTSTQEIEAVEATKIEKSFSVIDQNTGKTIDQGKQYFIYIPVGDKYLSLRSNLSLKTTLDQMLTTFKFTKNQINTKWKDYSNQDLGFSIQYPTEAELTEGNNLVNFSITTPIRPGKDDYSSFSIEVMNNANNGLPAAIIDYAKNNPEINEADKVTPPIYETLYGANLAKLNLPKENIEIKNIPGEAAWTVIFILKNTKLYIIQDQHFNKSDEMLGTLKLL